MKTKPISFFSLLKAELRRLLSYPVALLAIFITIASPAVGLKLYRPISSISPDSYCTSLNSAYLGNLALAGAFIGSICFALLTVITLSRDKRARTEQMIEALLEPSQIIISRVSALLLLAVITQGAVLLLWLPYTIHQIDFHFKLDWYLQFYLILMLPAILFAILFSAAIYQLCCQLELTLFSFTAVLLLSLTVWYEKWLLRWINPPLLALSDDFENYRLFLTFCYNRLFLFLFTGGLFLFSFLWIRRYQKNWLHSIPYNLLKIRYPLIGFCLLFASYLCYIKQPFFDHSGALEDLSDSETEFPKLSWNAIFAEITPHPMTGTISGKAVYELQNDSNQEEILLLAANPGYQIKTVLWNQEKVSFSDLQNDSSNEKQIAIPVPAQTKGELSVIWSGFPQEWDILTACPAGIEISQNYLYLTGADLLLMPYNASRNQTASSVKIELILPSNLSLVPFNSSATVEKLEEKENQTVWRVTNPTPYLNLYAGNYISQQIDADGTLLTFYYSSTQKELMEEYHATDMLKKVFLYCTSHYGPLSFANKDGLRLIEVNSIGGGYAGSGTSVMGEESFYRQSFEDRLKGNKGEEVLAHEIIHQWWGLGTMFDSSCMTDAWSSEGLTVYSTYRLMKESYGSKYARENYVAIWEQEVADYYQNFYVRHPEYFDLLPKEYQDQLSMDYRHIRHYCEMPLKILTAEKLVGGEEKMDAILSDLFQREIDPTYPYLTYEDFLDACHLTKEDLALENIYFSESNLY